MSRGISCDKGVSRPLPVSESLNRRERWYEACSDTATFLSAAVPPPYRRRTFPGIIGDIKALPPAKAASLMYRKKGLGLQYARLYLTAGIDGGFGYQACACESLLAVMASRVFALARGRVLDVGCAVGVTAGILDLSEVTGFDLFIDLVRTARSIDAITGADNRYTVADMTRTWPFSSSFDTVMCGLVCHHLKVQNDAALFFGEANRVLSPDGTLIVTLPAGSLSQTEHIDVLAGGLEAFGFSVENAHTGLVVSTDDPRSLFWMFVLTARKVSPIRGEVFVHPSFGFPELRTPVTREAKGQRVRASKKSARSVRHDQFAFLTCKEMRDCFGERDLTYETLADCILPAD